MIEANPNIESMAAYALPDLSVPDGVEAIILAQNEHPFPPSEKVEAALKEALSGAHLYPDSDWQALRAAIAEVHQVDPALILCGSGSMELMQLLVLAYLSPEQRILTSQYSYLFMRTLAQIVTVEIDFAAEKDFRVDVDALLDSLRDETRMVFLVNPGNPSGTVIHNDDIRRLRAGLPEDVILLVDEAYAEFVDAEFHQPLFDLVEQGNTVITRSFSKIYGLAGMRVGWGLFPAAIRDNLRKLQIPGNIPHLSQAAARAAMLDQQGLVEAGRYIARQRAWLSDGLTQLGMRVLPSQTNFVLLELDNRQAAESAFAFLRARGIVLRPMGGYGLAACLRITIGLEQQMKDCIAAIAAWQEQVND